MREQKSRSRHLIDPEIISAVDLIPTTDLTESTLMEARKNQSQMMQQIDVTQMFPITLEKRLCQVILMVQIFKSKSLSPNNQSIIRCLYIIRYTEAGWS